MESSSEELKKYKNRLLFGVIGVFLICVLIIAERIFNEQLQQSEIKQIQAIQKSWNLVKINNENYGIFESNFFFDMLGYTSVFQINVMLYTHLFTTIYVAFDNYLAIKLVYITLLAKYGIGTLQLIYGGARPYWMNQQIGSPVCITTYDLPSNDIFLFFLIIFYSIFCHNGEQQISKKQIVFLVVMTLLGIGLTFLQWFMGILFLASFGITILYGILVFQILKFLNNEIDSVIKKSTIQNQRTDAKTNVFYWFFSIILAQLISCMFYSGSNDFLPSQWIQNYVQCESTKRSLPSGVPYNELIGPWFTFLVSTCLWALVGAVFGIPHTARHINNYNWYQGSIGQRILKALIANLFMIPSWVLVIYQSDIVNQEQIRFAGLSEFFLNTIHFFLLYFFLFGVLPVYIFQKLFKSKLFPPQKENNPETEMKQKLNETVDMTNEI